MGRKSVSCYFDVGCSNGYITNLVASILNPEEVVGWDHTEANLDLGRQRYPHILFKCIDLNNPNESLKKADLVTCFETLEHVGNIEAALRNIYLMVKPGGFILISVPIESGLVGAIKYLIKTKIFRYTLDELSTDSNFRKNYEKALFSGADISSFRNQRDGWGSHFGFDYRLLEEYLFKNDNDIQKWTLGTTIFYLFQRGIPACTGGGVSKVPRLPVE